MSAPILTSAEELKSLGSRVRARVRPDEVEETDAGLQLTTTCTSEIERQERPGCVAERLTLVTG